MNRSLLKCGSGFKRKAVKNISPRIKAKKDISSKINMVYKSGEYDVNNSSRNKNENVNDNCEDTSDNTDDDGYNIDDDQFSIISSVIDNDDGNKSEDDSSSTTDVGNNEDESDSTDILKFEKDYDNNYSEDNLDSTTTPEGKAMIAKIGKITTSECNDDHMDREDDDGGNVNVESLSPKLSIIEDVSDECINVQKQFKSIFYNSAVSNYVIVLLKDVLYIQGTVKFHLIAGLVEIFGYKPKPNEEYIIYSPRSYANISIKPIKKSDLTEDKPQSELSSLLSTNLIDKCDKKYIMKNWSEIYNHELDAIILLKKNETSTIKTINKYMKEDMFLNVQLQKCLLSSEILLHCIFDEGEEKFENINHHDSNCKFLKRNQIVIDPDWKKIEIDVKSRIMIIGGKNVGKSTLLRFLINNNLNKIKEFLLIDLDIGQPEIFLPQTVSATVIRQPLLGPGYFNGIQPDKAYLFSSLNFEYFPLKYLETVECLLQYCKSNIDYQNMPWIINTMGYNKGIACELLSIIVEQLQLTDMIQIQSNQDINNYDYLMDFKRIKTIPRNILAYHNNKLHTLKNFHLNIGNIEPFKFIVIISITDYVKKTLNNITPGDKRYERILSHCGKLLTNNCNNLTDNMPYKISIRNIKIYAKDNELNFKRILDAMKGNFVYLCSLPDANLQVECYGLGLVRGIDIDSNNIHILTPLSKHIINKTRSLNANFSSVPSALLFNQGPLVDDDTAYIYLTKNSIKSKHVFSRYKKPVHVRE